MSRGATGTGCGWISGSATRAVRLTVLLLSYCPQLAVAGLADLSLEDAIGRLRADGLTIIYSSDLVKPWMRVREEPAAGDAQTILKQILAPYALAAAAGPGESLVIVRGAAPVPLAWGTIRGRLVYQESGQPVANSRLVLTPTRQVADTDADGRFVFFDVTPGQHGVALEDGPALRPSSVELEAGDIRELKLAVLPAAKPDLAEVVVSASRYELFRHNGPSASAFTAADLELLPEIGDDGLRAVSRLPGTAGNDVSAKSNVRGGEVDETLVRFDGLRLYNPFHLKDFQSLFSAIDPSLIDELNIYTGGFPVTYGDRMSSVIDITPLAPGEEPFRELSLSFFNASALASGSFNDGDSDWLVSARRGNLDLMVDVFDPDRGNPQYVDLYGRVGHRFNPWLRVSANALIFDDDIKIFDDEQDERAKADYRDEYFWLRFDLEPGDRLRGSVLAARIAMDSKRRGQSFQDGISVGELYDERNFDIWALQTDWTWRASDRLLVQGGAEFRNEEGEYDYQDEVEFSLIFLAPGASSDPLRITNLSASPDGNNYGIYTNIRFDLLDWLTTEAGLRWDKETLSRRNDEQFSPRFSALIDMTSRTSLRLSWGRFFQAQTINELQISDRVTDFFPAQRADHWIASLEHNFRSGIDLRVEAFRKEYRDPRPRFENLLNSLILLPELKPDRVRISPDKATAEGIEVSVGNFDGEPLTWWASYTWSSIEDDFRVTERPRAWDQTFTWLGGVGWRTKQWELSLTGTYRRGWPTTDAFLVADDPLPLAGTGPRNGKRLSSFISFDARVARNYDLGDSGRLTVFGQLNNMFNRGNKCCVEYEVEEREATGESYLDLENKKGIPIVPSLGVTWQF